MPKRILFLLLLTSSCTWAPLMLAADFRPNRILLVIGDQWDDPSGFLVREGNEFHELVSLLKNWGVPRE